MPYGEHSELDRYGRPTKENILALVKRGLARHCRNGCETPLNQLKYRSATIPTVSRVAASQSPSCSILEECYIYAWTAAPQLGQNFTFARSSLPQFEQNLEGDDATAPGVLVCAACIGVWID